MTALKRAMFEYVNEVMAGSAPRTDVLRRQLRAIQSHNGRYFAFVVTMLVVVFVAAMGLVVSGAVQKSTIPIASILGVSIIGMIRMMLGLWREKVATEVLIELSELDDGVLKQIVATLLRRMR